MSKKNPVEDALDFRTKESAARSAKDFELWQRWDQGGRKPEDLDPLLKRYNPLFNQKAREWKAPAVEPAAFKAELQKHFIKAVENYDPNRGVALNTHIQSRIQKAKRFNALHQNVGYIPEGQAQYIGPIQTAQNQLSGELGRTPTYDEIANQVNLGMPNKKHLTGPKVQEISGLIRRDVPSSLLETDPVGLTGSREQDVLSMMRKRPEMYFSPDEAQVFRRIYGAGAEKVTSTTELAKLLNTSPSKISRLKTSIGEKIKQKL